MQRPDVARSTVAKAQGPKAGRSVIKVLHHAAGLVMYASRALLAR